MKQLILGSSSPRRHQILSKFKIPFTIVHPPFDEEAIHFSGNPIEYVQTLSKGKGESLAPKFPHSPILTADTIVFLNGNVYNKPRNFAHAVQVLSELTGKEHSVFTGVHLQMGGQGWFEVEESRVLFNPLNPEQIHSYLNHIHWQDKSGGYSIEAAGGLLVNKIQGCYNNIVGLPVNATYKVLLNVGIDLWQYIR